MYTPGRTPTISLLPRGKTKRMSNPILNSGVLFLSDFFMLVVTSCSSISARECLFIYSKTVSSRAKNHINSSCAFWNQNPTEKREEEGCYMDEQTAGRRNKP